MGDELEERLHAAGSEGGEGASRGIKFCEDSRHGLCHRAEGARRRFSRPLLEDPLAVENHDMLEGVMFERVHCELRVMRAAPWYPVGVCLWLCIRLREIRFRV